MFTFGPLRLIDPGSAARRLRRSRVRLVGLDSGRMLPESAPSTANTISAQPITISTGRKLGRCIWPSLLDHITSRSADAEQEHADGEQERVVGRACSCRSSQSTVSPSDAPSRWAGLLRRPHSARSRKSRSLQSRSFLAESVREFRRSNAPSRRQPSRPVKVSDPPGSDTVGANAVEIARPNSSVGADGVRPRRGLTPEDSQSGFMMYPD